MTASGMWTPGTLARIHLAVRADASGPTPIRMKHCLFETQIAYALHVFDEHGHVVAILALHELGAGGDLLCQSQRAEFVRRGERIDGRSEERRAAGR